MDELDERIKQTAFRIVLYICVNNILLYINV